MTLPTSSTRLAAGSPFYLRIESGTSRTFEVFVPVDRSYVLVDVVPLPEGMVGAPGLRFFEDATERAWPSLVVRDIRIGNEAQLEQSTAIGRVFPFRSLRRLPMATTCSFEVCNLSDTEQWMAVGAMVDVLGDAAAGADLWRPATLPAFARRVPGLARAPAERGRLDVYAGFTVSCADCARVSVPYTFRIAPAAMTEDEAASTLLDSWGWTVAYRGAASYWTCPECSEADR